MSITACLAIAFQLLTQDPPLELVWEAGLEDFVLGSPLVYENLVIVASKQGHVLACHVDTGKIAWTEKAAGPVVLGPMTFKNKLLIPAAAGSLVLDPVTGKREKGIPPECVRPIVGESRIYLLDGIKFDNGYALGASSGVRCLTSLTGRPIWERDFDDVAISAVVEKGDTVYVTGDGPVRALNAKTGKVLAVSTAVIKGAFHGIADKDRVIFHGVGDDPAVCLDARTLKKLWAWNGFAKGKYGCVAPLIHSDRAVFFALPEIAAVDLKTGAELSKAKIEGEAHFCERAPALKSDEVVVAAFGKLQGFDLARWRATWKLEVSEDANRSYAPQPVWAGDRLLYAVGNRLYCFKPK